MATCEAAALQSIFLAIGETRDEASGSCSMRSITKPMKRLTLREVYPSFFVISSSQWSVSGWSTARRQISGNRNRLKT